jgi:hypothetical protein
LSYVLINPFTSIKAPQCYADERIATQRCRYKKPPLVFIQTIAYT